MKFKERLKELRLEKEKTQEELAEILQVKRYSIADWEQGRGRPGYEDLIKLAIYFDVTTDYLLGLTDVY